MHQIVLASSNPGKLSEIEHFLKPFAIEVLPQQSLQIEDVPETGQIFVENALLKARHAAQKSNKPALADDSGLVIEALDGRPGIYSARYAELEKEKNVDRNVANIDKVLKELSDVVEISQRRAHFYCCMVLMKYPEDPAPLIATGIWHGQILQKPKGSKGFGYDPIFHVPERNCSAAELDMKIKNQISHRGQALKNLYQQLDEYFRQS